jgi:hypothetical protein
VEESRGSGAEALLANAGLRAAFLDGYSQRRACCLLGIDPRVYRYQSSRPDDTELRSRLRELSSERRWFG